MAHIWWAKSVTFLVLLYPKINTPNGLLGENSYWIFKRPDYTPMLEIRIIWSESNVCTDILDWKSHYFALNEYSKTLTSRSAARYLWCGLLVTRCIRVSAQFLLQNLVSFRFNGFESWSSHPLGVFFHNFNSLWGFFGELNTFHCTP